MRGRVLGLQGTATFLGLTIGPTLGGLVTHHLGWRWVFWINLPVAAIGAYVLLRERRAPAVPGHKMDFPGAALFAAALIAGILSLEQIGSGRGAAAELAGACGVLLVLFIVRQRKAPEPLLPLWLFRSGAFSAGVAAAFLQYAVIFVPSFLVPFFLQGPMGLSADSAGFIMSAQPVVMVSITALAGWTSDKIGARWPASAGMAVLAFAMWRLGGTDPNGGVVPVVISLALVGLGVGLFTSPNNSAILGSAPRDRQGVASALLAAARNVGMVVGVSLAGTVLAYWRARSGTPDEALLSAFKWGMWLSAALAVAGAVLSLLRPPQRKPQALGTGDHSP
jgi:MFS family permease